MLIIEGCAGGKMYDGIYTGNSHERGNEWSPTEIFQDLSFDEVVLVESRNQPIKRPKTRGRRSIRISTLSDYILV